jgi:hypothetical protein
MCRAALLLHLGRPWPLHLKVSDVSGMRQRRICFLSTVMLGRRGGNKRVRCPHLKVSGFVASETGCESTWRPSIISPPPVTPALASQSGANRWDATSPPRRRPRILKWRESAGCELLCLDAFINWLLQVPGERKGEIESDRKGTTESTHGANGRTARIASDGLYRRAVIAATNDSIHSSRRVENIVRRLRRLNCRR